MARLFLMLVLLGLSGCGSAQHKARTGLPPGTKVEFALPRLGGGTVSLGSLQGHPVLITLFTTWCLRCQAEAPLFVQLAERESPRGLRVLGVALDPGNRSVVKAYVEYVGFRFDVLLAEPSDPALVESLGLTRQVPRTVLLDQQGRVVLDQSGQTGFAELRRRLEKLLQAGSTGS